MAISNTADVSFTTIQTEYGGANPIAINEYYRGGAYVPTPSPSPQTVSSGGITVTVPANEGTSGIPTSGQISLSQFRGTSKTINVTVTITGTVTNFDLASAIAARIGSVGNPIACTCTINSGVIVYSTSTATPAFTTGTGWASGSSVTIVNNGYIIGDGGDGGAGGSFSNGLAGGAGGTALNITLTTSINNGSGYVWGGGGGGGGGGSAGYVGGTYYSGGGGGGGGQAYHGSSGGAAGSQVNLWTQIQAPTAGGAGSNAGAGGGGQLGWQQNSYKGGADNALGGNGGAGGGYGADGATGGNATSDNASFPYLYGSNGGGAAGYYLISNGNSVTWTATGSRLGQVS